MVVALIAAAITAGPRTAKYVMSMRAETESVCIVIDPGHGAFRMRSGYVCRSGRNTHEKVMKEGCGRESLENEIPGRSLFWHIG